MVLAATVNVCVSAWTAVDAVGVSTVALVFVAFKADHAACVISFECSAKFIGAYCNVPVLSKYIRAEAPV
jgi:hypothetical protein